MGSTKDNLAAAFAGESQANRRYLVSAEKADAEGNAQIARLFRAAAAAETVHAKSHLRVLGIMGNTAENLKAAVAGELHEFTKMYPEFIEQAKTDGDNQALRSFDYANSVEKTHHKLYEAALAALEAGQELPEGSYYICPICGHTEFGTPPDKCPVCGAPGSKFAKID
jgi:rubrerythrin